MYNLELDKAIDIIKSEKVKTVLLQMPDGLKPKAGEIKDIFESKTNAEILIWGGSCYGACDMPYLNSVKVDILIQFGHSEWNHV